MNDHDLNRFCLLLKLCNGTKSFDLENHFRYKKSFKEVYSIDVGTPIVSIHSWTLMPNHFHLAISELVDGGISLFMKSLSGAYCRYFNAKHDRTGTLFEGRFKSKHVESDRQAKYLFSYISLNRIKLLEGESKWRERGVSDMKKVKKFLDADQYSSLFDYLYDNSPRLFSSIVDKKLYTPHFSNRKFIERELFDWLKFKKDGAEAVLTFK